MMTQKQGLTDPVRYPTMGIPGRPITYGKSRSRKTPVETRWAKQQTRSFDTNQLNV